MPKGYDYDGCDTGTLLNRVSVKEGRIVLPDGMSYRVLVLPDGTTMTPRVARKIRELRRSRGDNHGAEADAVAEPCGLPALRRGGRQDRCRLACDFR